MSSNQMISPLFTGIPEQFEQDIRDRLDDEYFLRRPVIDNLQSVLRALEHENEQFNLPEIKSTIRFLSTCHPCSVCIYFPEMCKVVYLPTLMGDRPTEKMIPPRRYVWQPSGEEMIAVRVSEESIHHIIEYGQSEIEDDYTKTV